MDEDLKILENDEYTAEARKATLPKIATYRKKPVETKAVQLTWANWTQVVEFVGAANFNAPGWNIDADEASDTCGEPGPRYIAISLMTTHGESATFRHGDWILPDSKPGTFYPVKPDVFEATYELVTDPPRRGAGGFID